MVITGIALKDQLMEEKFAILIADRNPNVRNQVVTFKSYGGIRPTVCDAFKSRPISRKILSSKSLLLALIYFAYESKADLTPCYRSRKVSTPPMTVPIF